MGEHIIMEERIMTEEYDKLMWDIAEKIKDSTLPLKDSISILEVLKQDIIMNSGAVIINGKPLVKTNEPVVKKQEYFEIPDNIHLDCDGDILFNDKKQVLSSDEKGGLFNVYNASYGHDSYTKDFVLVPCKREDLKWGDTAYFSDDQYEFDDKEYYGKVLDEDRMVYIGCDENVIIDDIDHEYWYKIVKRSEVERT
jgi:hypothetical protein